MTAAELAKIPPHIVILAVTSSLASKKGKKVKTQPHATEKVSRFLLFLEGESKKTLERPNEIVPNLGRFQPNF